MTIQEKIRATINTNIVNSVPGTMLVRDVDRLTNKILTDEAALGVVIQRMKCNYDENGEKLGDFGWYIEPLIKAGEI